jgi:hypothetical protein
MGVLEISARSHQGRQELSVMAIAARMHRILSHWNGPLGRAGMARQVVRCALVLLAATCLSFLSPLLVYGAPLAQSQPLVTVELRYHIDGASEVYLVWGVNGWNVLPEAERPEGTALRDGIMHTLMSRQGDTFGATLRVPQGTIVDYGFAVTRTSRGAVVQIWQGKDGGDYHSTIAGESAIDVEASPSIATQVATGHLGVDLPWLGLVLAIGIIAGLAVMVARARSLPPPSPIDDTGKAGQRTLAGQLRYGLLWGIVLLGLVLRLHVGARWNATHPDIPEHLWGDETGYNALALKILDGASLDWPGRVPLYPFWLAGVLWLTDKSYSAIPYVQALLGVTSILLTYHLGRRMFGHGPALLAAFLAATSYPLVRQSVYLLSEVLYTPIVLIVMITLWDALQEPSVARASWAGFWVGLSALVRPTLLFFPLAAIVVYMVVAGGRRAVSCWGTYAGVALLVVLPWTVRVLSPCAR